MRCSRQIILGQFHELLMEDDRGLGTRSASVPIPHLPGERMKVRGVLVASLDLFLANEGMGLAVEESRG